MSASLNLTKTIKVQGKGADYGGVRLQLRVKSSPWNRLVRPTPLENVQVHHFNVISCRQLGQSSDSPKLSSKRISIRSRK